MTEIEQISPSEQVKKEQKNNNKLEVAQEETSNFLYNKNCAKFKHPQQTCLEKSQRQEIPEIKQEQQDRFAFYKGNFIKESPSEQQMSEESQFKAQLSCQSDQEKNPQQRREGYNNHSSKKRKRKNIQRSAHHNSQKHAVVTIKAMVQFYYDGQRSDSSEAAQKIWKGFMQTRRKNKAILNVLFGTRGDNPKQLQQLLSQYNFKQLLNYSYQQIKKAQAILREMVINQITSETLHENLKNRRIANKNQFREYMINFVEQLKEGPIRRRILKEVSSKISQLAQVGKYIQ